MREVTKTIELPIDEIKMSFRLTKLDAFSGAALLQLIARLPEPQNEFDGSLSGLFSSLSQEELRGLMQACLNHVEVLLPAGYQPIMQGENWTWPELEHDAPNCLKLTLEESVWSLSSFFGAGGSKSRSAVPNTPQ